MAWRGNLCNRRIAELVAKYGVAERSGRGMSHIYENSVRADKRLPARKEQLRCQDAREWDDSGEAWQSGFATHAL